MQKVVADLYDNNNEVMPLTASKIPYWERGPDELLLVPNHVGRSETAQKDLEEMRKVVPAELPSRIMTYRGDAT
jgi:hypothetical protein